MKKYFIFPSLIALIVGCAGPGTTKPVTALGPDTFTVRGWNTEDAVAAAGDHCNKLSKKVLVTNLKESNSENWGSVIFQCLNESDPAYQRPEYRKPATTVIEDRRR